jgi:PII-like signaling protein
MRFEGTGQLLRIFIGESDRFGGKPLFQALVEKARAEGLAGATVLRGIEGFGASSHLHTSRILRLSEDLPIIIEIVDTTENIGRVMDTFDAMVGDGMMTLEAAQVITYRGRVKGDRSSIVEDRLRMLAEQAREIANLEGDPTDASTELESSVVAAHQYGATEAQIVEASGMVAHEVRRILRRLHPTESIAGDKAQPGATPNSNPSRLGRFSDGHSSGPLEDRIGRFSDGQSSGPLEDRIGRFSDGQSSGPLEDRIGRFSDGQARSDDPRDRRLGKFSDGSEDPRRE